MTIIIKTLRIDGDAVNFEPTSEVLLF